MTEWQKDDWISAYLDDEMSSQERELAQSKIDGDPELQRQIEMMRRLGNRIRHLPTHRLPASFAADIRQQVTELSQTSEQDASNIALANSQKPESFGASLSRNTRDRGRVVALGILGTLAASLLVAVVLTPSIWQGENERSLAQATDSMADFDEAVQLPEAGVSAAMEDAEANMPSVPAPAGPGAMSVESQQSVEGAAPPSPPSLAGPRGGARGASQDEPASVAEGSPEAIAGGGFGGQGPTRQRSQGSGALLSEAQDKRVEKVGGPAGRRGPEATAGELYYANNADQAEWYASLALDPDQDLKRLLQTIEDLDFQFSAAPVLRQMPFDAGVEASPELPGAIEPEGITNDVTSDAESLVDFQSVSQAELAEKGMILYAVEGTPQQIEQLVQQISAEPSLSLYQQTWKEVPYSYGAGRSESGVAGGSMGQVAESTPASGGNPMPVKNGDEEASKPGENQKPFNQQASDAEGLKSTSGTIRIARDREWSLRLFEKTRQGTADQLLDPESTQEGGGGNLVGGSAVGSEKPKIDTEDVSPVEVDSELNSSSKTEDVSRDALEQPRVKLFIVIVSKDQEDQEFKPAPK